MISDDHRFFERPFLEYLPADLTAILTELELPKFRLQQIRRWIFARKITSFNEMTDLSKETRQILTKQFGSVLQGKELTHYRSDDSTEKLLIEWADGERVECVLLRDNRNHRTACISTQVGCAMGCAFCASGMDGFVRNLSRGEILEQFLRLNSLLPNHERLTHVVVMGIGEPLLNLDALLSVLDEITASDGLDLSVRRVTISTVGIPSGIRKLAESVVQNGKGYKLAISLHAPNDELRTRIIPQNRFSGIDEILKASDNYFEQTGRRVTFEYTLIAGLNDQPEHVRQLVCLLKNRMAIVNIIPLNPVLGLNFQTPSAKTVSWFAGQLESMGIQVKVRFRKGDKIEAACGQLRRVHQTNPTITN
ncbi:MAG: 23S rRNA (adenine(2503)-C(2))-methyltransferase RlmN [Planctomycetaceae bacterium]|jgi:23S rRNA (adenine2503-C2)-methyltransferase|nr:23S rRNA (adenine(2503)-C(2))-methyltransferase RlmN [Planctomycetaceae bacterium]